jgi:hypothetical protein
MGGYNMANVYEVAWVVTFALLRVAGVTVAWIFHSKPFEERMDGTERTTHGLTELTSAVQSLLDAANVTDVGASAVDGADTTNNVVLLLLTGVYGFIVLVDVSIVAFRLANRQYRVHLFEMARAGLRLKGRQALELSVATVAMKSWYQNAVLVIRLYRIPLLFTYVAMAGRYQQSDFYNLFAIFPTAELALSLAVYLYYYNKKTDDDHPLGGPMGGQYAARQTPSLTHLGGAVPEEEGEDDDDV